MKQQLYVHEYVEVPFREVAELLQRRPSELLGPATDEAVEHANRVRANLIVDVVTLEIGRAVEIEVGEFQLPEEHRGVLPLAWQAADAAALFPLLEANLEVAALSLGPPLTQVSLVGNYDPPWGPLGTVGDNMFGHRIAQAALHRFLNDVVQRIQRLLGHDTTDDTEV